ncbi:MULTISPECIES: hypothetical protein [unclassified Ectothiorhodospira]|uniref:hypothetical protein n=1 Tax=Ectothiorhodospira sp. 9905 TaxID=2897387 RepID=UPI001EE8CF02|nr:MULTISPECIES: hypothetical protein [unclassified Ectothiorhodospira]MCG5514692.1 hypothetical protein [Ectothiorhodospira sp. 9100]MCG5518291.1 hypothetical protein [Ectothiorhodospira sp. 9905]
MRWAEKSGPNTAGLIRHILNRRAHPQQGFRSCLGILRLGEQYGSDRRAPGASKPKGCQFYIGQLGRAANVCQQRTQPDAPFGCYSGFQDFADLRFHAVPAQGCTDTQGAMHLVGQVAYCEHGHSLHFPLPSMQSLYGNACGMAAESLPGCILYRRTWSLIKDAGVGLDLENLGGAFGGCLATWTGGRPLACRIRFALDL